MTSNFKVGDPALIIRAQFFPDQIGVVCELIQFHQAGDQYITPQGEVLHAPEAAWMVGGDAVNGGYTWMGDVFRTPGQAIAPEKYLMPLRGDFTPEQQKAKEAEPCA